MDISTNIIMAIKLSKSKLHLIITKAITTKIIKKKIFFSSIYFFNMLTIDGAIVRDKRLRPTL